jgi:hydroxymethylpyrimidine/phosphomethylpyrimidine kinase
MDLQTSNPPKEPNAYLTWINNYVADDYTEAVRTGRGMQRQDLDHVVTC